MLHAIIKGRSDKEILITSYLCHPSMANNELSGPVVLSEFMKYIRRLNGNHEYTYRFVLGPETIGAIAYISRYKKELKSKVIAGINLSCVGDNRAFSFVETPTGKTELDNCMEHILSEKTNFKRYSFEERGSDERQYCSPNIYLQLITQCRRKFHLEYFESIQVQMI